MKKLKVSILLNFLLILIIILIVLQIIFSISISNNISGLSSSIYNHPFIVTNELKDINISLNDIQNSLENITIIRKEELKYEIGKINLYENKIENSLEIILEKFSGDIKYALDVKTSYDNYKRNVNRNLKEYYSDNTKLNRDEISDSYDALKEKVDKVYISSINNAEIFSKQIEKEKSFLNITLSLFIITSVLYAFIFLYIINIKILSPLKKVIDKTIKISDKSGENTEEAQKQNEIEILERTVSSLEKVTTNMHKENIERKNAENLLKIMNSEMKEIMKSKDKIFSIIAHDLRNPFNAIIGYSDYLKDNIDICSKKEAKDILCDIKESAQSQFTLLQNLLDWSRSQLEELRINKETIKLSHLINEVINQIKIMAQKKEINFINKVPGNIYVYTDKIIALTLLNNLISNAIKYSQKNGNVIISAYEDENFTTVKIEDNGCGIDETDLPNIFNIDKDFIRPDTEGVKGTGLGLIICKELVDKQNGKIWAESILGKGSTFCFSLPKFLFKSKLSF